MLRIEHFTKTYGTKTAVDDLSLHIAPGEIFGFIGHNGAGKTTTLKACCGILQFTKGEIFVAGHSIRKEPLACKRELAYIPDNPDLYDFLTGLQYLNFVADIYGVSQAPGLCYQIDAIAQRHAVPRRQLTGLHIEPWKGHLFSVPDHHHIMEISIRPGPNSEVW